MKHIFLTGAPGVGKSTLIMRITEKLQEERNLYVCGFRTDEVRQQPGGRIGFDIINIKGSRKPLSRLGEQRPLFDLNGAGKMELFSRTFFPAVRQVLSQPHVLVLGTIPMMKPDGRVMKEVEEIRGRKDVTVVTVTQQNRNMLASELFEMLMQRFKGL
ncbi:NTPase-domain-containing protein [Dunaliella salina]|uniref:NTPase-domain-containing protein n=1 Tax=Dunaliella salina TaxID=3046 RepID=A0ABQ7GN96_DUNSA|nr:NTPase-domain-containing protein [Dunaliella salina]|eukprot:KAF5836084.1 NTPase-domain-containing protein [Dunaliella salina]